MKLEYQKVSDYYLPLISVPEGKPLRHWGRMRRDYLRNHRPVLWNTYLTQGTLWEHLNAVDDETDARMELLIEQMKKTECITEKLKRQNPDDLDRQDEQHSCQGEGDYADGDGIYLKYDLHHSFTL